MSSLGCCLECTNRSNQANEEISKVVTLSYKPIRNKFPQIKILGSIRRDITRTVTDITGESRIATIILSILPQFLCKHICRSIICAFSSCPLTTYPQNTHPRRVHRCLRSVQNDEHLIHKAVITLFCPAPLVNAINCWTLPVCIFQHHCRIKLPLTLHHNSHQFHHLLQRHDQFSL